MDNLSRKNNIKNKELTLLLKDIQYYMWLSSLRECWKKNEIKEVSTIYVKLQKYIEEMDKHNNNLQSIDENYELVLE